MGKEVELRGCWSCGGKDILCTSDYCEDGRWACICQSCYCGTGFHEFREDAVSHWNRRASDEVVRLAREAYKAYHHRMFTGFGTQESINAHAEAMEALLAGLNRVEGGA